MDHVVFLDSSEKELENLISGNKSMIITGSDVENLSFGSIHKGDILYFIDSQREREVKARGIVSSVYNSGRLSREESFETVIRNQDKLQLPDKLFDKWAGRRYLLLLGIIDIQVIEPFITSMYGFASVDNWLPVDNMYTRSGFASQS